MTAQMLEVPAVGLRPRPARPARSVRPIVAPHRDDVRRGGDPRRTAWSPGAAKACAVRRPTPATTVASADGRLYWTPRGIAVMVLVVAATVGVMLATVVGAFLAVSNEPLEGVQGVSGPGAAVVAPAVPGR